MLYQKSKYYISCYIFFHEKVANPMCPGRQATILRCQHDAPLPEVETRVLEDVDVGEPMDDTKAILDGEMMSMIAAMESTSLTSDKVCNCTRKCATISCPCRKSVTLFSVKCHPRNTKCQNK